MRASGRSGKSSRPAGGGPRVPRTADAIATVVAANGRVCLSAALWGVWSMYRSGFSVSSAPRAASIEEREGDVLSQSEPGGHEVMSDTLEVEARTNRRTALVELRGELDLATVGQVADVLESVAPDASGVRHIVLDLRGLTFMDARGLRELIRQNDYAHQNRHNLAIVRGRKAIQRLLALTTVEELLVLVDDPEDLVPPPSPPTAD